MGRSKEIGFALMLLLSSCGGTPQEPIKMNDPLECVVQGGVADCKGMQ